MHYIVGLGNPGKKYEGTRHNVGRAVLEKLQEARDFLPWEKEKNAFMAQGELGGTNVTLVAPETFMNRSGEAVREFVNEGESENTIVIHDEIDLPVGTFKISYAKGAGGHNGVNSVANHLKTKNFARIRVGVAPVSLFGHMKKPQGNSAVTRFVLGKFKKREREQLEKIILQIHEAIEIIIREGAQKAMNDFNHDLPLRR